MRWHSARAQALDNSSPDPIARFDPAAGRFTVLAPGAKTARAAVIDASSGIASARGKYRRLSVGNDGARVEWKRKGKLLELKYVPGASGQLDVEGRRAPVVALGEIATGAKSPGRPVAAMWESLGRTGAQEVEEAINQAVRDARRDFVVKRRILPSALAGALGLGALFVHNRRPVTRGGA